MPPSGGGAAIGDARHQRLADRHNRKQAANSVGYFYIDSYVQGNKSLTLLDLGSIGTSIALPLCMTIQSGAFRIFLMLVLLMSADAALAGDLSTVVNGKSFHIGSDKDWNENNFGLGIEYQLATQSRWKYVLMANGLRDSQENMSYMAGGGLHRNIFSSKRLDGLYVDLGLNVFLMTRRYVNDDRPFPGALPSLTVGNRIMGVNLTYVPKAGIRKLTDPRLMDKSMRGVVFLQFKMNVTELMRDD